MVVHNGRVAFVLLSGLVLAAGPARAGAADAPEKGSVPAVSAKQITADYAGDETAAQKKYGSAESPRQVVVEGVVASITEPKFGVGKVVKLAGTGQFQVTCLMKLEDAAGLKKGDKVTIKGNCRGLFKRDKVVDINGPTLVKEK